MEREWGSAEVGWWEVRRVNRVKGRSEEVMRPLTSWLKLREARGWERDSRKKMTPCTADDGEELTVTEMTWDVMEEGKNRKKTERTVKKNKRKNKRSGCSVRGPGKTKPPVIQDVNEKVSWWDERKEVEGNESGRTLVHYFLVWRSASKATFCPQGLKSITTPFAMIDPPKLRCRRSWWCRRSILAASGWADSGSFRQPRWLATAVGRHFSSQARSEIMLIPTKQSETEMTENLHGPTLSMFFHRDKTNTPNHHNHHRLISHMEQARVFSKG